MIFWKTASVVQQVVHILDGLARSIQKGMDCPDHMATLLTFLQTENVFHIFVVLTRGQTELSNWKVVHHHFKHFSINLWAIIHM